MLPRYHFGVFTLSPLNAPGLLMVVVLLIGVCAVFLFYEEPVYTAKEEEDAIVAGTISWWTRYKPLFQSLTIVAMVCMNFFVQFTQQTLETFITPVGYQYYNFGQLENSIMYSCIAGVFFFWFLVIVFLSRCVADRVLIGIGVAFFGLAFCSMMIVL
jgi:hypothetical protein